MALASTFAALRPTYLLFEQLASLLPSTRRAGFGARCLLFHHLLARRGFQQSRCASCALCRRCAQVALYNAANREVAILCNHQRTVSNAQKEGLEKQKDRLEMMKGQKSVRSKLQI